MKQFTILALACSFFVAFFSCQSNDQTADVIGRAEVQNFDKNTVQTYYHPGLSREIIEVTVTPDGFTPNGITESFTTTTYNADGTIKSIEQLKYDAKSGTVIKETKISE